MSSDASSFLGHLNPKKHIHIIGGGFSGLCLGFHLKKAGLNNFTIYEKKTNCGGLIESMYSSYGKGETGAHAFFASEEMAKDLYELGLSPITASPKLKKKIYRNSKFTSPPLSFIEIISLALRFFFRSPPTVTEDTTLADFLAPLGNKKIQDEVFATFMVGVYAADSNQLNLKSLFRQIDFSQVHSYRDFAKQMKKTKSAGGRYQSLSFKSGMSELINGLRKELKEHIQVDSQQTTLLENSIVCTNAHDASDLLSHSPVKADLLRHINYLPVSAATLITKKEIPELKRSFGCLFSPRTYKGTIRGILNNWEIFPDQRKQQGTYSYTFIMGTERPEEHLQNELKNLGIQDIHEQKVDQMIKPWKKGLPLYDLNRAKLIEKLRAESWNETALFGNYIGGISLREIYLSAKTLAQELANE